ncbi:MAG: PQQ-like beta-propeller repeat protein [Deltaproteobacteria bacterium]|nr:PQQ-like beta-propeller repeat protein [Deltaproteobacteria bacterium]
MDTTRARVLILTLTLSACGDDDDHATDTGGNAATDAMSDAVGPDAADTSTGAEVSDVVARWDPEITPWPMFGGDPQRTGRSAFDGPTSYTEGATGNWRYEAAGGASINMQPTVTADGVYFGTWGLLRGAATTDTATSLKSDGRYVGLGLDGAERFAIDPAPLAACYAYAAEAVSKMDEAWCGEDAGLHVTFYNGTIEGTGLVDPWSGLHYVGRGDGRLYAIAPDDGRVVWSFPTFDPTRPDHPDGGGEVVGGATMGPDGTIYFATFGVPWPGDSESPARETQAVYAIDRQGDLVWRHPAQAASLDNPVTAAVALSPDGGRVYVGTWGLDRKVTGRLLALEARGDDASRVAWDLALEHATRPLKPDVWVRHVSVGGDGILYIGGTVARVIGAAPVVMAVRDLGASAEVVWVAEPDGYAEAQTTLVQGLALGDGVVFASTGDVRDLNGREGRLAAIDMATGEVLATFDPGEDAPGSMTGPLVDRSGRVYVGTRGRHDLLAEPWAAASQWRRGVMFGLAWRADERRFAELWRRPVDAQLDWATPAIDARGVLFFGSTAPLPTKLLAEIWDPMEGVPPRTSPWLFAIAR